MMTIGMVPGSYVTKFSRVSGAAVADGNRAQCEAECEQDVNNEWAEHQANWWRRTMVVAKVEDRYTKRA